MFNPVFATGDSQLGALLILAAIGGYFGWKIWLAVKRPELYQAMLEEKKLARQQKLEASKPLIASGASILEKLFKVR
jgi:hypothetical protein